MHENYGDMSPGKTPKRVEGMDTGYAPGVGNEPGGAVVNDAQRRAIAPILGTDNGRGTSTDKHSLGYTLDSFGRTGDGNLGKVESSNELHQYMASKKDKLSQAAIKANRSRLGRKAMKNGFGDN